MPRGGRRTPRNPAPVSGPGALSARTDGGGQPVRVASGGAYGERKALEGQQQAAPLAAGSPVPGGGGGGQPPQGAPASPLDVFTPTERPGEPITSGIPMGPGAGGMVLPPDPDEFARAVFAQAPSEDLRRLLEWRDNR